MTAPYSLRLRLILGATAWLVLALVLVGLFIVQSFSHYLERERLSDLQAGLKRIVAELDVDAAGSVPGTLLSDPRYDTPLSGVYWQVEDIATGEVSRSRSLWDFELPRATSTDAGAEQVHIVDGPDHQSLIVLSQLMQLEGSGGARSFGISVAESRDDPAATATGFAFDIAMALALVGIILLAAAWLLVWFGLRPLKHLRQDIEQVRRGMATKIESAHPTEVHPLVVAVNDLLAGQQATLTFARHRAADLAHGLKTPLAVLSATAERLRSVGDRSTADIIDLLGQEMNERVDYQLKLARLRLRTPAEGLTSSLNTAILRSISVLRKTERGERINWIVDLAKDIDVNIDEHDLMELVGILLENAGKWASGQVVVNSDSVGTTAVLDINDDGDGLTDDQIASLGSRGTRMDQSRPGEGIGLAIAFEIARLNRGALEIVRSDLGGIRAHVSLPIAEIARPPKKKAAVAADATAVVSGEAIPTSAD
jgi:signal transduction histidine kinase